MKIGITCNKLCRIEQAAKYGFDYLEVSLKWLQTLSPEELDEFEAELKKHGVTVDAFNCFYGPEVKLMGDEVDLEQIKKVTRENVDLAARFNPSVVVIGSGGARTIPEGFPKEKAVKIFSEAVDLAASICAEKGIRVVIEPLRHKETNFINTILEGKEMGEAIGNPNVGCLIDFFHFAQNGEEMDTIDQLEGKLIHAHLARPSDDRLVPRKEDEATVRLWMEKLRKIGYDERLTLECSWKNANSFEEEMEAAQYYLPIFRGQN